MKVASRIWVSALVVWFAAAAARAQGPEPVLVIAGPSYNTAMTKLDYVARVLGQPQLKQQVEGMLTLMTQGRGIPGLDKTKPIGLVLFPTGGFLQEPDLVAFVPLANAGQVLQMFQFPAQPDPQRQGVLVLSVPQSKNKFYVKSQNGWTWITPKPARLDKLPQDPSGWLGQLAKQYDLAAQFRMRALPKETRQQIIQLMQIGAQAGLQEADETQRQVVQAQMEQFQAILESLDEFTLGLQIDPEKKQVALDIDVGILPESPLGRVLRSFKVETTRMTPFVPQQAMVRMAVAATMGKEAQDYVLKSLATVKKPLLDSIEEEEEFPDEESRQAAKQLMEQAFGVYEAMIRSGKLDVALAAENQQGKLFCNAAIGLPQGHQAGQVVHRLLELFQAEGAPVQFNAAAKDGVTYHRIPLAGFGNEVQALLGEDASLVVATGPQGLYVALGPRAMEQLQQRVSASVNQPPKQAAHYEEFTVSVGPLFELIQQQAPNPALVLVAGLIQGQKAQVRLTADLERTRERVRLEVDEALLRLIGSLIGMGAGGGVPGGPQQLPGTAPPKF